MHTSTRPRLLRPRAQATYIAILSAGVSFAYSAGSVQSASGATLRHSGHVANAAPIHRSGHDAAGPSGSSGSSGASGRSGTSGVSGSSGASGVSGTSGVGSGTTTVPAPTPQPPKSKVPETHTGEPWAAWPYWLLVALGAAVGLGAVERAVRTRRTGL